MEVVYLVALNSGLICERVSGLQLLSGKHSSWTVICGEEKGPIIEGNNMVAVKCAVHEVCSCTVVSKQKRYELIVQNHNFKRPFTVYHTFEKQIIHEIIYSNLKYTPSM